MKTKEFMRARGVRFPDSLWNQVKEAAKEQNVLTSDIVREAVYQFLQSSETGLSEQIQS